ncbi:MAG TPA: hypothetical protein VFQ53_42705 [Kofleriaceae bacterium]|nr:hypothetical protein [Kofleriaceae bacterium]
MKAAVAASFVCALVPATAQADSATIVTRVATAAPEPPASDLDAPPAYASATAPSVEVPPDPIVERQASIGAQRGFITPTALTVPEGRAELSVRALAPFIGVIGIAGGITSTTELWVDAGTVMTFDDEADEPHTYAAGLKQVLGRGRTWAIAATASARQLTDDGDADTVYSLGGVATICADDHCNVMMHAGGTMMSIDEGDDTPETLGLYQLGFSAGSAKARFLVELVGNGEGGVVTAGARIGGDTLAAEFALARPFDGGDGEGLAVLPVLGVMARL